MKILAGVIEEQTKLPVLKIGRICGQYGKPRTSPFETVDGAQIHSYLGDNVNSFKADAST